MMRVLSLARADSSLAVDGADLDCLCGAGMWAGSGLVTSV